MNDPILVATGLTKSFGGGWIGRRPAVPAVRGVDLTVGRGETVAVVGESGAGKSTVGRMVLRLIEPDSGTVTFEGVDLRSLSRAALRRMRPRMQMVFQDPFSSLDPTMSIGDSIGEPLKVHRRMRASERHERVVDLLRRVGLRPEHAERYPRELSGGQQQRIAIARAVSSEPSLIVCDEPVAALDLSIRGQVLNLLVELQQERKIAYLFISHDLSVVRHFAHRVVVMYAGQVVEARETAELYESPRHPYTQALLAAVPIASPSRRRVGDRRLGAGERLPLAQIGQGCAYRNRCPMAMDVCETTAPVLREQSEGGSVACHLFSGSDRPSGGPAVTDPAAAKIPESA